MWLILDPGMRRDDKSDMNQNLSRMAVIENFQPYTSGPKQF